MRKLTLRCPSLQVSQELTWGFFSVESPSPFFFPGPGWPRFLAAPVVVDGGLFEVDGIEWRISVGVVAAGSIGMKLLGCAAAVVGAEVFGGMGVCD